MALKLLEQIRAMPVRQQVGLYAILKKFHQKGGTVFSTADFMNEAQRFFVSGDIEKTGKILGGVMTGLIRKKFVLRVAKGNNRESIWSVAPDLHSNAKAYAQEIFPVYTYWEKENAKN